MSKENAKLKKWMKITPFFENYMKKNRKKLKSKIRKGIPDSLRGEIWMKISGADKMKQGRENLYNELISKINQNEVLKIPEEETIIKDMNRTYPKSLMFMNKLGDGQRKLFRVLSCFSSYNKKIGYVQGMSFITGLFLSGLNDLYTKDFPGLKKNLFVFLKLMQKLLPDIFNILSKFQLYPSIFASSWYLTCYTNVLSFENSVRIMDCFLFEGTKIIHRIALGILSMIHDDIMKCKGISDIMEVLKNIYVNIDIEELFKISFGFSISKKQILQYEILYNEQIAGRMPIEKDIMDKI